MTDTGFQPYFRIVVTDPPTLADFVSQAAAGKQPKRDDPETFRLWSGISVYETRRRADERARDLPWLGTFIAEMRVPSRGSVSVERTTNSRGITLFGPIPPT